MFGRNLPKTDSLVVLIIYIFLISYPFFADFKIGRIRIDDVSYISDLVRDEIANSFDVNSDISSSVQQIYKKCESSPWASDCRVSFQVPNVINVEFRKVVPVAFLIEDDGKVSFISGDGQKIETHINISRLYKFKEKLSLPFVKFQSSRCSMKDIADFISYVRSEIPNFLDQVLCSDFSLEIYSTEKYKVILPLDDLYDSFNRFMKMRNQIGNVSEIDVRGKNGIFVR